jgi:hypothetical protein
MDQPLECPRCRAQMENGYVVDVTDSGPRQQVWHPGEPVPSFWVGLKMKRDQCVLVTTLRCPGCGYLESYALRKAYPKTTPK